MSPPAWKPVPVATLARIISRAAEGRPLAPREQREYAMAAELHLIRRLIDDLADADHVLAADDSDPGAATVFYQKLDAVRTHVVRCRAAQIVERL